ASGCVRASGTVLGGTCASDIRLKTDIRSFDLGLAALFGVSPKIFKYSGLGEHPASVHDELGVVAQDVEKSAPELIVQKRVKLHKEDQQLTEIKEVNYSALIYVVINAVKELHHLWFDSDQEFRRELSSIKAENARLKAYLCGQNPDAPICH